MATAGVVYDVNLVFDNDLGIFTGFLTLLRVEALIETCIATALLVISWMDGL